jgi:eukaryotic-like serine/threonine-protein kinase
VRLPWLRWGLAAAVLVGVAGVGLYSPWWQHAPVLAETDTVVLAEFSNTTGEPVFDEPLRQALAVKLEESPYLDVFPEARVRQALQRMDRPADERLTATLARDVCRRQGFKAMLAGAIARLGSQYVISLDAIECETGDTLARAQESASGREGVLKALGAATTTLRQTLGESLASIEQFDAPVEDATTASLEALRAYALAQRERDRGSDRDAVPLLRRATEVDPRFALAHARLGAALANIGQLDGAREAFGRAYELRNRTSERERLYIEVRYHDIVHGDLPRSIAAYEAWQRSYPRDWTAPNNIASLYWTLGQPDKAVAAATRALELNPDAAFPYGNLARAYLDLGRLDEAKLVTRQAVERGRDGTSVHWSMFRLAWAEADTAGMERQLAYGRERTPDVYHAVRALLAARAGRLQEAEAETTRQVEHLRARRAVAPAAHALVWLASLEQQYGHGDRAIARARAAVATSDERSLLASAGRVLALGGQAREAEQLFARAATQYAEADTLWTQVDVPTNAAALRLGAGDAAGAADAITPAAAIDCACRTHPRMLRAQASLAAGRHDDARAWFEKVLDAARREPDAAEGLAQLGLARAAARAGDTEIARRAYQDALATWKEADPGLPAVEAARKEYGAIGGN